MVMRRGMRTPRRGSGCGSGGRPRSGAGAGRLITPGTPPLAVAAPRSGTSGEGAGDSGANTTTPAPGAAAAAEEPGSPGESAVPGALLTAAGSAPEVAPASVDGRSPTMTSSTTTVMLSLPPARLAMATRLSDASWGSGDEDRTSAI